MTRLKRMNADEVERILRKYGFELISQKGSHRNGVAKIGILRLLFLIIEGEIYLLEHYVTL